MQLGPEDLKKAGIPANLIRVSGGLEDPDDVIGDIAAPAVREAASIGVDLHPRDVALRYALIALEDGRIKNHSAGHISTQEASLLIHALNDGH